MKRLSYIIFLSALALFAGCDCKKEELISEEPKSYQTNEYYRIFKVEDTRRLRTPIYVQLANRSSEIHTVTINVFMDNKFMLSTNIQNGDEQVFGLMAPSRNKKMIIEVEGGETLKEVEIEPKARTFIGAILVDAPSDPSKKKIVVRQTEIFRPGLWNWYAREHIQSEVSTSFAPASLTP